MFVIAGCVRTNDQLAEVFQEATLAGAGAEKHHSRKR